jgi:hypothetical protein
MLSTSRIIKIATIRPTSMKPCSLFAPRASSAHPQYPRESRPQCRSQEQIFLILNLSARQQRQRLPIVIRHIFHLNGVR